MSVQYCQSNSCGNKFGLFKKKTKCFYCEQYFCRSCIKTVNRRVPSLTLASLFSPAPPLGSPIPYKAVNVATCPKCMIMSAPGVSSAQIMTIDTRLLKLFLLGRRIPIDGFTEKSEIVQLVVDYNRGLYPWTAPRASESNTTSNERANTTANTTRNTTTSNATRGVDIDAAATSSTNMRASRSRSTFDLSSNNAAASQETTAARSLNSDEHLSSNSLSQPNQSSNQENEQQQEETDPSTTTTANTRRASLSDLKSIEDIESLTIRDIKVILTKNFVNYKGCVEKDELKDRLRRLYKSNKELEERQQQMNNPDTENTATTTTTTTPTEKKDEKKDNDSNKDEEKPVASISKESGNRSNKDEDLCKICMDRLIDCLLLECGHMCSCVKCGKLLNECPICRQYVVRVVRAFKS